MLTHTLISVALMMWHLLSMLSVQDGVYRNPFQEAERKERQSDMVARKAVTLQPAVNVGHTAGPQLPGQALVTASASPSTGMQANSARIANAAAAWKTPPKICHWNIILFGSA